MDEEEVRAFFKSLLAKPSPGQLLVAPTKKRSGDAYSESGISSRLSVSGRTANMD